MKTKKVYLPIKDFSALDVYFVPDDYCSDAGGARDAREDGLTVHRTSILLNAFCMTVPPETQIDFGKTRLKTLQAKTIGNSWTPCELQMPTEEDADDFYKVFAYDRENDEIIHILWFDVEKRKHVVEWMRTGLKKPDRNGGS